MTKPKQNIFCGLKHADEHFSCENYISNDNAVLELLEVKNGDYLVREEVSKSTIAFVLSGEICVSTASVVNQRVAANQMYIVAAGDNFYGKAIEDAAILRCSFTWEMSLCNRFSIEQLQTIFVGCRRPGKGELAKLPILDMLQKELCLTRDLLKMGLSCIHFQQIKQEMLFIELCTLYTKEELSILFSPILGVDNNFKERVMQIYRKVETAQELIDLLNISPSTFKRKFREEFGMSARQWLIHKKEQRLIRDILMTDLPISELADKYKFTPNYMTTFCRTHFGKAPTELRMDYVGREIVPQEIV